MGRLVVVSNRVPVNAGAGTAGGLAVALRSALQESGGLWFGWSGETGKDGECDDVRTIVQGNVTYALVDLTKRDRDEYYSGFANRSLWPLFHYRLDLTDFSRRDMDSYFRVNRSFAARLKPLLKPDDVVWVHDYHLIPLAFELRELGVTNRMGFFLHIPCPPPDVLFALPPHQAIVRALAGYDLVGFQTRFDADNFATCLIREGLGRRVGAEVFDAYGRVFRMGAYPIGIETSEFAALAEKADRSQTAQRMRASLNGRGLIIGVDRLDYSKGIGQRIEAFARFLDEHPERRNQVTYLQVTPKSRSEVPEYADMQRQVAELAGRVNGERGDIDWTPIQYINRTLKRPTLAGLYRMSKVGLVTPLRDGMNLVAKEYVAAQPADDPGVLVLSRFAGAARELDGAILVNPYDIEGTAKAIAEGLSMPREERIGRWRGMYARILRQDVTRWRRTFLADLAAVEPASPLAVAS